jgi:hypothetical protein
MVKWMGGNDKGLLAFHKTKWGRTVPAVQLEQNRDLVRCLPPSFLSFAVVAPTVRPKSLVPALGGQAVMSVRAVCC